MHAHLHFLELPLPLLAFLFFLSWVLAPHDDCKDAVNTDPVVAGRSNLSNHKGVFHDHAHTANLSLIMKAQPAPHNMSTWHGTTCQH